jgi:hypothetical protein
VQRKKLSEEFKLVEPLLASGSVTVGGLLQVFGLRGMALLSAVVSIPFLLPLPLPGLSSILCWIVIFSGLSIALGRMPRLPKKLLDKKVALKPELFQKIEPIVLRIEKFVKPRYFPRYAFIHRLIGFCIFCSGVALGLPLPPGGNIIPAIAIILLCVGYLEGDGIAVLIGGTITLIFCGGLLFVAEKITVYFQKLWGG